MRITSVSSAQVQRLVARDTASAPAGAGQLAGRGVRGHEGMLWAVRGLTDRRLRASDLRREAVIACGGVVALSLLGLAAFRRPTIEALEIFDLSDLRITVPSLVSAGLLASAAMLCRMLDAHDRREALVRTANPWLFGLLALDEIGHVHDRAARVAGGEEPWHILPLALGVAAGVLAATRLSGRPRRLLWAGTAVWAVAQGAGALAPQSSWLGFVGEILDLVAAALMAFALLAAVQRHARVRQAQAAIPDLRVLGLELLRDLDIRRVALVLALCNAFLFVMGWLVNVEGMGIEMLDATGELGFPAWFDGTLLLTCAALVILLGALDDGVASRRWLIVMGVTFATMASDELLGVHEKLGGRLGISGEGQVVLAPLIVVAAIAWYVTLRGLWRDRQAAALFTAGAVSWVVAQAIDTVYGGIRAETPISAVFEDSLEAVGSTFFVLGLLTAVGRLLRSRASVRSRPRRSPAR